MIKRMVIIIDFHEEENGNKEGATVDVMHRGTTELDVLSTLPGILKETANMVASETGENIHTIEKNIGVKFI